MMVYTAFIVDDEFLARSILRKKLESFSEISIIGEAATIGQAVDGLGKYNPDILFLDIQLTEGTGFDLLNMVKFTGRVIFITAFDEYALRAFSVNALDYLLKPVSKARLKEAIGRITSESTGRKETSEKFDINDRLLVSSRKSMNFIKVNSIITITSATDYTRIRTVDGKEWMVTRTMNEWEERLPGINFCRIHRGTIINLDYIEKTIKRGSKSMLLYIEGIGEPFTVSRSYLNRIRERYS